MLANGIKLGYKETSEATSYTNLPGLKEVPDLGVDPEKVDNTCLEDKMKHNELGIGDPGDMAYKFKYENGSADSSYRKLRALADSSKVVYFQEEFPDGTKFTFSGMCSVKVGGGGVNSAIDFTLTIGLQSDIAVSDPATATS